LILKIDDQFNSLDCDYALVLPLWLQ